ncbi:MAG: neutral/alkaline non-lysosomal ceramidase N-terminal domain-containing protein [Flammeovirgaceae bacterium]
MRVNIGIATIFKKLVKIVAYIALACCLVAIALIAPIDNTPLPQQSFYQSMQKRLDTLQLEKYTPTNRTHIGWSEFNITPNYPMPMAGYTPKNTFESVHDSLYGRVLYVSNGNSQSFFISLDLMLFPPIIKKKLIHHLQKQKKDDFLYLSATHTHSGIGGWDDSVVGKFTIGTYHAEWVEATVNQIISHMEMARSSALPALLSYWQVDAFDYVENRLDNNAPKDGWLRGLTIKRADSSKAMLVTFSAHPTNMELLGRVISGDYPSALIKALKKEGYSFGMFLAGMVGSHRIKGFDGNQFQKIDSIGKTLTTKILASNSSDRLADSITVTRKHIPIEFGASQLHFAQGWKTRDWAFRLLVNPLQGEITYLQLGDVLFLGTPCDFSGEVFAEAHWEKWSIENKKHLIITSFNGNYVGYITADRHYNKNEEEVLALNWVGPYFGDYFTQMIDKLKSK